MVTVETLLSGNPLYAYITGGVLVFACVIYYHFFAKTVKFEMLTSSYIRDAAGLSIILAVTWPAALVTVILLLLIAGAFYLICQPAILYDTWHKNKCAERERNAQKEATK